MVELQNVSRWYGEVIGINDVTCQIQPGITALLGQNGAGKSTLIKLVTGQLKPTTGSLTVFGHAPFANPEVYKVMGYCPEIDNFYEHNSGREFVRFLAALSGLNSNAAKRRTDEVLDIVGMADRADRPIASYSKGMRQRIKLAQALINDPKIILLDEPLNGLDPVGRHDFVQMLHHLAMEGRTVMVSSHILYEVETMTRSILLLHRGRLLAEGDLATIRSLIDRYPQKVRILAEKPRDLAAELAHHEEVISVMVNDRDGEVEAEVRQPEQFYHIIAALTESGKFGIVGFHSPDNNLESVFSYLVRN